jgi:phage-related protein
MEAGEFIFNGKSSLDYGVRVQNRPDRISAKTGMMSATPSNRNGSVFSSLGVLDNVEIVLKCFYNSNVTDKTIDDISDWLYTDDYANCVLWYDQSYTYKAIINTSITFTTTSTIHDVMEFSITLEVYPLKYLTTGLSPITLSGNTNYTNPTKYEARPFITLTGTGANVSIIINGRTTTIESVTGDVTIDSEAPSTSLPAKYVGLDFPYLDPGMNVISFTASKCVLVPNIVRRVV